MAQFTNSRYFEYKSGTTNRWWEISWNLQTNQVRTRWGKIGKTGGVGITKLINKSMAEVNMLIARKKLYGYIEVTKPNTQESSAEVTAQPILHYLEIY